MGALCSESAHADRKNDKVKRNNLLFINLIEIQCLKKNDNNNSVLILNSNKIVIIMNLLQTITMKNKI